MICSKNRGFLYCFAKTIKKNVFYDRFSTEMITFEIVNLYDVGTRLLRIYIDIR